MTGPSPKSYSRPHPRLGHPRPVHPHPPGLELPPRRRDRPPGGPLRTGVAQREELLVGLVRADLPRRVLQPLLDLREEPVDQLRTGRRTVTQPARFAGGDIAAHRVMRAPRKLSGVTQRPSQVERFQNFHDLPCTLHGVPSRVTALQHRQRTREGASTTGRGEANDVVSGRSHDHQRATPMSATGQLRGRLREFSRGRCHPAGRAAAMQAALRSAGPLVRDRSMRRRLRAAPSFRSPPVVGGLCVSQARSARRRRARRRGIRAYAKPSADQQVGRCPVDVPLRPGTDQPAGVRS